MTRFIRLLTAATVLVHATVGCCAHEGHSFCGVVSGDSGQTGCQHGGGAEHQHSDEEHVKEHHGTCDHAPAPDLAEDNPSEPSEPHDCEHAKCNWAAPELRDCDQFQMQSIAASFQCSLLSSFATQFVKGSELAALSNHLPPHTVALRAHLAKCVLLI